MARSTDADEDISGIHEGAVADGSIGDDATDSGGDFVKDLHGLDETDDLAGTDAFSDLDVGIGARGGTGVEDAGHRGGDGGAFGFGGAGFGGALALGGRGVAFGGGGDGHASGSDHAGLGRRFGEFDAPIIAAPFDFFEGELLHELGELLYAIGMVCHRGEFSRRSVTKVDRIGVFVGIDGGGFGKGFDFEDAGFAGADGVGDIEELGVGAGGEGVEDFEFGAAVFDAFGDGFGDGLGGFEEVDAVADLGDFDEVGEALGDGGKGLIEGVDFALEGELGGLELFDDGFGLVAAFDGDGAGFFGGGAEVLGGHGAVDGFGVFVGEGDLLLVGFDGGAEGLGLVEGASGDLVSDDAEAVPVVPVEGFGESVAGDAVEDTAPTAAAEDETLDDIGAAEGVEGGLVEGVYFEIGHRRNESRFVDVGGVRHGGVSLE